MPHSTSRREFLKTSLLTAGAAAAPALAAVNARPASKETMTPGLVWGMLPENLSIADRFKLAADAGFRTVEAYTTEDNKIAEEIKRAAENSEIRITSVMNQAHWKYPLSSADPEVVKTSMDGMRRSLHNAKLWGAEVVLLVPAVVNAETRYQDAWTRSQKQIRELIPLAAELKVIIAVEEVWNKFLLSPLEFARYVDEYESPWVRAYFDVGNVVISGYPQDWIRTLGRRIVKVHLKDFKMGKGWNPITANFVNLGEGDIDWPQVRAALAEVDYTGVVTAELAGGDLAYLTDVRKRIERLVLGWS
ncbi:MAG: sugar phosphate isomerase/epimerase [Acidobacteria bacterium]|nr:sugar phosphate isomerase/epimerase [Acidobacteriota bacterium]